MVGSPCLVCRASLPLYQHAGESIRADNVLGMDSESPVGVIGGSGFYSLLDGAEERRVPTPYGEPSDAITVGTLGDRKVAFVPRHGADHRFAPHVVPYRANLWALRSLGV